MRAIRGSALVEVPDPERLPGHEIIRASRSGMPGDEVVGFTEDGRRVVAIDSEPDGLYDRLLEVNDGRPVDVVPAPSGGSVFEQSLDALAPFGRLDGYAAESATVDPVGLIGGSRAVIGFWLGDCLARPEMVARALSELMGLTSAGRLLRWPATSTRCHRQVVRTRTCSPGAVGTLLLDPSR